MLFFCMAKRTHPIEPIYREIGDRVRALLKKESKTAEKLAFEIDLGKAQMYLFLTGKRRVTIHTLERIAIGLEVPLRDLLPMKNQRAGKDF
jgi:transcriptional regulator with XRE-family HTH domain